jgi:hypothetical protein
MIDRFVTYLLIGGCLIFGALVLLELRPAATGMATPNEVSRHPDTTPAVHRQPSTQLDELLAVALARPLFSSTRRPPQAAANDTATDSDLADTRLTGIVTEPDHHLAIFSVNGATKPLRLTEGEALSGWRIESITPHEVSLSGPGGTKTLQPKLDPNLVQQPPPQPAPVNPAARQPAQPPAANVAARQPAQPPAGIALPPRPAIPPRFPARPPVRPLPGRAPQ